MSDTPNIVVKSLAQCIADLSICREQLEREVAILRQHVGALERDAECFRIWVREAECSPISVAKAIAHCVTEDDYRKVLLGIRDAGKAAIDSAKALPD